MPLAAREHLADSRRTGILLVSVILACALGVKYGMTYGPARQYSTPRLVKFS
jgi:hypothetical protein